MRVTIKPHLKHYFCLLQEQLECDNPSEVLNYLLTDLKLKGYSFLADYQYVPNVQKPVQKNQPLPQDDIPQNEDPIIKRLSALLEDF
ncbi:hypothetical protein [Nostoc sp. CHAB 5715]|uniref:hypothetical protein n=1 Tax=Nostoc sp. CHAB 5715 TaxID=2780400 RepID=UPI001E3A20C8|nr:hypothetical protein [Nostoc sp. CHAB 5715]MCC5620809.1 hypothetical protein [Nostoc sp. CHAB 5715]